jgi:hypothetical protein
MIILIINSQLSTRIMTTCLHIDAYLSQKFEAALREWNDSITPVTITIPYTLSSVMSSKLDIDRNVWSELELNTMIQSGILGLDMPLPTSRDHDCRDDYDDCQGDHHDISKEDLDAELDAYWTSRFAN